MSIIIRRAGIEDAGHVAKAVDDLLLELFQTEPVGPERVKSTAGLLARTDDLVAFLAFDGDTVAGALTLSTCFAVYAAGPFGEIAELYVAPAYRSKKVGAALIDRAIEHAREKRWPSLKVGAPPADTWSRTVDFYKGYGFHEIGPRLGLELTEQA
ncbi:MAG: GNAT family N-acetyltransferase [Rhodospirillaceae bacterium]|jgi:GNAT superfamily N-acetyltransferase|nr:GNAT family N-acetyltransferase [Rhodospirillaceae bacterium]MBT6511250.1 GNAT family N-acetyltransferase [Rhodospirillaceae bacterium]MBT7613697.1 GNAT family N-acetyltransferase [Rhodospirillaceae bacterium]